MFLLRNNLHQKVDPKKARAKARIRLKCSAPALSVVIGVSEERQAQAEAWIRKPKRTTHNQWLIELIIMLAIAVPIPLCGVIFALAFAIPYTPLYILVTWAISSCLYIGVRIYVRTSEKKRDFEAKKQEALEQDTQNAEQE